MKSRKEIYQTEDYINKRSLLSQKMWQDEEYKEKHKKAMNSIETKEKISLQNSKQIRCIELNKIFRNVGIAAKELDINYHPSTLSRKIKNGVSVNGYHFEYLDKGK